MKKVSIALVALFAALFTCLPAEAQLRFGAKAGVNIDKLHFNENAFSSDNRCGFTVGAMGEFMAPLGIGVDLSLMYTYMKADSEGEKTQFLGMSFDKGYSYLEIPLNLKYKLTIPAVASVIKPYVFTGPSLALKLGGDNSYFKTKTCQWGWNIGLGVELINHLQISGGYTFGMNNIFDQFKVSESLGLTTDQLKVKNNYWTVTAAWLF